MSDKKDKGSSTNISSVKRSLDTKADGPPIKKGTAISLKINSKGEKGERTVKSDKNFGVASVSLKLQKKPQQSLTKQVVPKTVKTAAVFNDDSDSEPEEMPAEARMRMKNVGRDTPTSAGPNSFNKSRLGFIDGQKQWEAKQKQLLNQLSKKV